MSALAVVLSIGSAGAASAVSGTADTGQLTVGQRVTEVLHSNPAARRINTTQVELEPGVVLTVGRPGAAGSDVQPAVVDSSCPYGGLCLWENVYRGGERISFSRCGTYFSLSQYTLRGSNDWRDDASSIWNNQYGGVVSYFYDFKLASYHQIKSLSAGNYLQDLTRDASTWGGGNLNDRIDRVYVC